ncbi:hypothetical protein BGZ63DRAFT_397426 [Mariannaea sp. PMI_226]|nr:hypothetical protein BGZ63DRAFT_397426 [Mariannaea sp. PMI_226]
MTASTNCVIMFLCVELKVLHSPKSINHSRMLPFFFCWRAASVAPMVDEID